MEKVDLFSTKILVKDLKKNELVVKKNDNQDLLCVFVYQYLSSTWLPSAETYENGVRKVIREKGIYGVFRCIGYFAQFYQDRVNLVVEVNENKDYWKMMDEIYVIQNLVSTVGSVSE